MYELVRSQEAQEVQAHPVDGDGEDRNSDVVNVLHGRLGTTSEDNTRASEQNLNLYALISQLHRQIWLQWSFMIGAFGLTLLVSYRSLSTVGTSPTASPTTTTESTVPSRTIHSLAFGSCSAYDLRELRIFPDAIISSSIPPDAWIWLGDMVYLDDSDINCNLFVEGEEWQKACNCSTSFIQSAPFSCHAGDLEYAATRWLTFFNNRAYRQFLQFMCPQGMDLGALPPQGNNPAHCERFIYGIYDDHDFGWNNGNGREPHKRAYKELYLDAIGEAFDSVRRGAHRGLWAHYVLNQHLQRRSSNIASSTLQVQTESRGNDLIQMVPSTDILEATNAPSKLAFSGNAQDFNKQSNRFDKQQQPSYRVVSYPEERDIGKDETDKRSHTQIDIFALDERYERAPLPCETRRALCEDKLSTTRGYATSHNERVWCTDFLANCCHLDEDIFYGWCTRQPPPQPSDKSEDVTQQRWTSYIQHYQSACNLSAPDFGLVSLVYDRTLDLVRTPDFSIDARDAEQASSFCEVLGRNQRQWLRRSLQSSRAAVKLVLSGSVLLHDPRPFDCISDISNISSPSKQCRCGSGDNLDCYRVAQQSLLHMLGDTSEGESSSGCVIVLTGDYHFSDLKILSSANINSSTAAEAYNTQHFKRPIYQIMASGLSSSTARPVTCADYRLDPLNLREPHAECAFVTGANYGRILFEYDHKDTEERRHSSSSDQNSGGNDDGSGKNPFNEQTIRAPGLPNPQLHPHRITKLRLQILSGQRPDHVLLETVIDDPTGQCKSARATVSHLTPRP